MACRQWHVDYASRLARVASKPSRVASRPWHVDELVEIKCSMDDGPRGWLIVACSCLSGKWAAWPWHVDESLEIACSMEDRPCGKFIIVLSGSGGM